MCARVARFLGATMASVVSIALVDGGAPVAPAPPATPFGPAGAPIVRITSPLGRTGTPGLVRIVARVESDPSVPLAPVRVLIDEVPYKVDDDGPPYVVEWNDDNPFERRVITVEAEDALGQVGRDTVTLAPFEVTEKSGVFSVVLEATVRDRRGRFVLGLQPATFEILEDEAPQRPELVSQEGMPATFVLLVDSSQSMRRRFDMVRQAAGRLLGYLRPIDSAIVVPFTTEIGAVTGPTTDRETVAGAIGAMRSSGGTAIFDALQETAHRIAPMDGLHNIILITDGYDENSRTTLENAVLAAKASNCTVYVVAIGGVAGVSMRGDRQLRRIAEETGGRAFFLPRMQDLPQVYDQLALDSQNRYLLTFTPTNQKQDGTWRTVHVGNVAAPGNVVTTRDGYFAPKAPPIRPMLEFTVTDASDRYADVVLEDLVVLEEGVEQQVDTFQEAVDPVQIVLTLDQSGSMRRVVEDVKAAAAGFVSALRPNDPLAVITFADRALFAHDISTNRSWSFEAIDKYVAAGGTALYDALYNSIMRLKFVQGRRAVVLLTDGRDENNPGTGPGSTRTLNEVLTRLQEVEAVIYPIGLGSNVDRAFLTRLAELSGGRAYFPASVAELPREYDAILENIRRRYVLSYDSTNIDRDGKWRRVDISVKGGGFRVKSRGGYYSPER